MRENSERNNELNEQELEQAAGGVRTYGLSDHFDVIFRCPECNTAKRVTVQGSVVIAPRCDKCHKQMEKA